MKEAFQSNSIEHSSHEEGMNKHQSFFDRFQNFRDTTTTTKFVALWGASVSLAGLIEGIAKKNDVEIAGGTIGVLASLLALKNHKNLDEILNNGISSDDKSNF